MERAPGAYGNDRFPEIDAALQEALARTFGRVVRDAQGRFEVTAGVTVWAEHAGRSVFVRVALPPGVRPGSRWVPPDVSSSGEEGVRKVAAAAAIYLADELRYAPPTRYCA